MTIKDIQNRVGKFSVTTEFLHTIELDMLNKVFKDIYIVKAEHNYAYALIDYVAVSPLFDCIDVGQEIEPPRYTCTMVKGETDVLEWKRI